MELAEIVTLPTCYVFLFAIFGITLGNGLKSSEEISNLSVEQPIVTVTEGQLRGALKTLINGEKYYSFKGIPYAETPVRFMAPRPPQAWLGIRDAVKHGAVCPQYDNYLQKMFIETEDCLFLNVYSKNLTSDAKTPVLVFIHGGGFKFGSGNYELYSPDFLLQHNIMFVTFNYRLEALGFLSLDTPEVPGNAGMKDQVLALKWIQKNIANFGGDPHKVTIYGESAGAASVTYHLLSPMSEGLFHGVIAQSGVSITDWAVAENPKDRAFELGKILGKDTNNTDELLKFLQEIKLSSLVNVTHLVSTEDKELRSPYIKFVPVVEKIFPKVEAFMTEKAIEVLTKGNFNKVPLMVGYNSAEGIFFLNYDLPRILSSGSYYPSPILVKAVSHQKLRELSKRIKNFYAGDKNFTKENQEAISNLIGDQSILYPSHVFANHYSNFQVPVYMFRLDYDTDLNIMKKSLGYSHLKGFTHADDWFYFFLQEHNRKPYTEQKQLRDIVYNITKMWADFTKYGNPTPNPGSGVEWKPYTKAGKEYLKLGDEVGMGSYADQERMEFWNEIYKEVGLPHIN